jgi:hypothetical protein
LTAVGFGCGSRFDDGAGGGGGSASSSSSSSGSIGTDCTPQLSTTLPGVRIELLASGCSFSLSDPSEVVIPYQIVIEHEVPGVVPASQDAGGCGTPGPSGLIPFEQVDGGGKLYCMCDVGLCPSPSGAPVTLQPGTYPTTFAWDKRAWTGPSDTMNPKGSLFPSGDYTLSISAAGSLVVASGETPFEVLGTLPIHLVP